MSIIKADYLDLAPQGRSLSDVVVLAQAWKKSHDFIRRHNWYADMLELDASTIDLEDNLNRWSTEIQDASFLPKELLLVPAPKNAKWEFRPALSPTASIEEMLSTDIDRWGPAPTFGDWAPKPKKSDNPKHGTDTEKISQKLRPLAHLSIRDQTLATAVMMCLAEAVETVQGNTTDADALTARDRGVVSYGNRLHCSWIESGSKPARAKFSWGNNRTFRQYFQDYRAFLARPRRVCSELSAHLGPKRELYVVSLDIKSFFDRIDVQAMMEELKRIEGEYRSTYGIPQHLAADEDFWSMAKRICKWKWQGEDHRHAKLIHGEGAEVLDLGLPQGLVAAGFFANAYVVGFDDLMREAIAQSLELIGGVKIIDYCRYVDDMRVVVEATAGSGGLVQDVILDCVKEFVTDMLHHHCGSLGAQEVLELSDSKCDITPYRSISAQSHLSSLMEMLNAEISGTFDLESLAQAAGGLDGLLWMSDQIDDSEEPKPSRLSLSTIAVPTTDVRDDTVKRFVAARLAQLMRQRLAMTDMAAPAKAGVVLDDGVTNGMLLSHEFETTARKLIKCWSENPSLALLLRCGMDLFPHPRLLAPVAEALGVKLFDLAAGIGDEQARQVKVAEYVAADLFRAGAVETGFRSPEEYPELVDIEGYREELGSLARRILNDRPKSPWYLEQQAHLYLASIGDVSHADSLSKEDEHLVGHQCLYRALKFSLIEGGDLKQLVPFALVAQQLAPSPRRFGVWLSDGLNRTEDDDLVKSVVVSVSLNRPDLMTATLGVRSSRVPSWRSHVPRSLQEASKASSSQRRLRGPRSSRTLIQAMVSSDNPFAQENGLLMLAKALLNAKDIAKELEGGLSPSGIALTCIDWSMLQSLPDEGDFLKVTELHSDSDGLNPIYAKPSWVDPSKVWLYGLGRVLRAALTGEYDFTSRQYVVAEEVGRYGGLRSSWYKRRFGLMNTGRGLLEEPTPISPWLSGFLSTLLQWPGVEFRENGASAVSAVESPEELLALVESRIAMQRALYGSRSQTPIYVLPTNDHAPLEDRPLRVAIVQPLRPKRDEIDVKDPTHWTPGAMAEHRQHLAEVCRLAHQQLRTWASAQKSGLTGADVDQPIVDVVLFPELAVHPEHVFLLRRLSDKLRANIFAGLTFIQSPKVGGVVNQGLWLIRTESSTHGRSFQYVWQGKKHPMKLEAEMGVKGYRPHVTLVEFPVGSKSPTRVAAAICYDATDLDLVADLRDKSDMFLVAALNQDVQTFDNMVAALHFHMYQPVVLANSGEFGGSTAQAPLPKHDRLIAHMHGGNQVAVSVFEIDPTPFKSTKKPKPPKELKGPPAGYQGRPV